MGPDGNRVSSGDCDPTAGVGIPVDALTFGREGDERASPREPEPVADAAAASGVLPGAAPAAAG